ncbi:MAG: hypothetical protein KKC46_01745 [Proteobacteria bacterium]|nr:hypothetical protein [Pseudomonadota bacterium]
MRYKKTLVFILSAGLSLFAAVYRWGDSGHAIGLISERGGKARHPSYYTGGKKRYTQIVTAKILPPYHGDARVVLEGSLPMNYELFSAEPIVDMGFRDKPRFQDNIFYDLKPGDRISLWLVMRPVSGKNKLTDPNHKTVGKKYSLAFYDTGSGNSLLRVPIIFKEKENTDETVYPH